MFSRRRPTAARNTAQKDSGSYSACTAGKTDKKSVIESSRTATLSGSISPGSRSPVPGPAQTASPGIDAYPLGKIQRRAFPLAELGNGKRIGVLAVIVTVAHPSNSIGAFSWSRR